MRKPEESTIQKGKIGEDAACSFLEDAGYRIVNRNFHTRAGEIDIIFFDEDVIVFAEVKMRRPSNWQEIEESIDIQKINKILKSAEIYLEERRPEFREMRIDSIFILNDKEHLEIKHYKNFY